MQQEDGEAEDGQQPAPLRCPRCNSTDTKFRYYNNNDRGQPRHYCKTCRRYWTVGGSMRNIPFGGSRRSSNGKPAKDSSCLHSGISSSDEWEHKLQHPAVPIMAAVDSHNFGATKIEPLGSLSAPIPPAGRSYDLNDEISCLAAIQSLTQPQSFNTRNHFGGSGTVDMNILQDRNFQSMSSNQHLPQQLPSYGGNPGHPNWPMNPLPQDFNNNFRFSASNASIWNNSNGNTSDPETARTSMNSNNWPHLSNYGGPAP